MSQSQKNVLVLGGGFAGLFAALYLRQIGFEDPITLIDRETRFIFRPLLYDLLSREVQVDMVWPRYDELLLSKDIKFVTGEICDIDIASRQAALKTGLTYDYDYLVLGLGNTTGYFGVPGAQEHSFAFRNGDEAFELGKHLRVCLQQAKQDPSEREKLLTVVIVGAGASGVELAATLGDLLPQWYENLEGDIQDLRIVVMQRGNQILQGVEASRLRETAQNALQNRQISVELLLETDVKSVTTSGVEYAQADTTYFMPASTVIWTAGNTVNPLIKSLPIGEEHRDRQGRLHVQETLQLLGHPEIFAGGDCAVMVSDPQPTTAQVAYQQGSAIATNILAHSRGEALQPATVNLRGTLLKLGMDIGVAEIFDKYEVKGHMAHLVRQAVYLNLLPTPARNLKLDTQWLTDEVFDRVLRA